MYVCIVLSTDPQKQPNTYVQESKRCVPLPYIICDSVVFEGYFRVVPVHFKCMHYKHF